MLVAHGLKLLSICIHLNMIYIPKLSSHLKLATLHATSAFPYAEEQ